MTENSSPWTQLLDWLKARLSEPNTWTWLVAAIGYFGYTISPEMIEYIMGVCVSLIAMIQVASKDTKSIVADSKK